MEVGLFVPVGTDVSVVKSEYPDLSECEGWGDEEAYFIGHTDDEDENDEWMTYDQCVEFCGFAEGAAAAGSCMITGNGPWAQGMISSKYFSDIAATDEEKRSWEATSKLYWAAFERGKLAGAQEARNQ